MCQGMPVCLWGVCAGVYNKSRCLEVYVSVSICLEGVCACMYLSVSGCVFLCVCAKTQLSCILY